ncbi:acyl-CoA dehydrogenase family protein [Streptomyces sp. NPDC087850]|uniref:acyl-CoA dehydrogenase family protein n=1 Tax=Streptomyces sp. NPDC087850 TaxID=3365809 RepID=UPI0037F20D5E
MPGDRASRLADFLGDPLRPDGPLTYGRAVADDRRERFPGASLDALHDWGYSAHQVPEALGGRLASLEELFELGRVVAGRDPAVAVIANSPVASAMPVWLAGTPAQRTEVARSVLNGERVALGLTERDHGADLLSGEVTGHRTEAGYTVNGTKWLINNIRLARFLCLLVREPDRQGLRSLTLLLIDLHELPSDSYELLPKISTHGIRGADIAGIRFRDARVPASACVGRPGRGLELIAQALFVTRTLVPGLSLGALDTSLRCTVDFLRERRLYGGLAIDIPFVQDELAAAYLDLSVAEVVGRTCVRALHLLPDLAPVSSAVAKYLVPHLVESRMRALSTVLGARYFLREGHWAGIFEKMLRDVRLFSLFDGSEPVVLSALAAQASCLGEPDTDHHGADRLFAPAGHPQHPLGAHMFPTVADEDPVTAGLEPVCTELTARAAAEEDTDLHRAAELLRTLGGELYAEAERSIDPRAEAGQRLGDRYARVFAAVCLARTWLAAPDGGPGVPAPWLAAGLVSLLRPGTRMGRATSRSLCAELLRLHADGTSPYTMFPTDSRGSEAP